MTNCTFCDPPMDRIFHEGRLVLGLWDGFPVSDGHALLVTRRHVASWFDASPEERQELTESTLHARNIIEARFGTSDFNIGVNVGAAAGQTIPHLHVHLMPRRPGDVEDPRGGVRHVIPSRGNYLGATRDGASATGEALRLSSPPTLASAIVGEPDDPLLPHLVDHLDHAERADFVIAFVLESGMRAMATPLRNFLVRGGRLRLLTGDYLDVTEPRALRALLDLEDFVRAGPDEQAGNAVSLRVFETGDGSFHPKSYVFHLPGTADRPAARIAYVGSSNLSRVALAGGTEWNYRVLSSRDRLGIEAVERRFDDLFEHERTRPLTNAWIDEYERRRIPPPRPGPGIPPEAPEPPPIPTQIQREALAALAGTRAEGNRAGLVVMATGLGKTFLAAFHARESGARRILFVAHREEILRQTQASLRRVLPDATIGLHAGGERAPGADIVLASIQTLSRSRQLETFARDAFDLVIVDEFHHASAATYRRLIAHFEPGFLLGLTATPERMDGGDLLALCGENLVYRCDLHDAIRRAPDRLVPFHYFGIADDVDYTNIPWRGRRFDVEALTQAVATDRRASATLDEWRRRRAESLPTLGFCCSRVHADFMAAYFQARGVRAAALHAGSTSAPRSQALKDLEQGHLDVLFAVDILNEGVDIPAIGTVLMLRPTESSIVFLQQLGRGLRRHEGKTSLAVIDHVGNHRSFLLKPRILFALDAGDAPIERLLARFAGGTSPGAALPEGCEVHYDLRAIDLLRGMLRPSSRGDALVAWYEDFIERSGGRPRAVEAFHEGRNPRAVRTSHGSWLRFLDAQGGLPPDEAALLAGEDTGRFLDMLEVTPMTRSFKMVLLQALLNLDALPGSARVADLTAEFVRIARRSARLRADVGADLSDARAMSSYLQRNPIAAWTSPQASAGTSTRRTYFRSDASGLHATFGVPAALRDAFRELVGEIAEWRIADHLFNRQSPGASADRIRCKVLRNMRHPILKLPDRKRREGIPEGDVAVLVDGQPHVARFASRYVNVLWRQGETANRLGEVLTRWFGPEAGRGGTLHHAEFARDGDAWTLGPLRDDMG